MAGPEGSMPRTGGREGASPVPAIVEFPTVVQEAVRRYGHLFPNVPERRHNARVPDRPHGRGAEDRHPPPHVRSRPASVKGECAAPRARSRPKPGGTCTFSTRSGSIIFSAIPRRATPLTERSRLTTPSSTAMARPATCTWCSWRTVSSSPRCGFLRAREWAHALLMTVGEACRAVLREALAKTLSWAIERVTRDAWEMDRVKIALSLT